MNDLNRGSRIYVCCVMAAAAVVLAFNLPNITFENPWLFVGLLLVSAFTSAFKVSLPLAKSGSTMSVSYAVDFAALLLLGPHATMIVAIGSAWSQCTFRMKQRNPTYRTIDGVPGHLGHDMMSLAKPLVGAATTYFVFNTALIAVAIALSTRQPL